jgi:hypothetical protein
MRRKKEMNSFQKFFSDYEKYIERVPEQARQLKKLKFNPRMKTIDKLPY